MVELPAKVKPAYLSKTIYINLLIALAGFVAIWWPPIKEFMSESNLLMLAGVVNLILRAVTKEKLVLF